MSNTLAADRPELDGSGAAAPARTPGRITIGGNAYTIERPSARKASTAFRLLKAVSSAVKSVTRELGEFEREYRRTHVIELDRAQARLRYPRVPVLSEVDGSPLRTETGDLVLMSPLDHMTEEDWQRSGNVLKRPISPTKVEMFGAVFELALEQAEEELYKLLALFTLTNAEVARYRKEQVLDVELEARADEILDEGGIDEVLELAVVIGETVDEQFRRKAAEIGASRVGKALRLLGLNLDQEAPQTGQEAPQTTPSETTQETTSSSSKPTSSTGSPEPSPDGDPTSSSTPTTPSSSPSAPASSEHSE